MSFHPTRELIFIMFEYSFDSHLNGWLKSVCVALCPYWAILQVGQNVFRYFIVVLQYGALVEFRIPKYDLVKIAEMNFVFQIEVRLLWSFQGDLSLNGFRLVGIRFCLRWR